MSQYFLPRVVLAASIWMLLSGVSAAQSNALASRIEKGYGSSADIMDKAFDPSTRDANGNRIVVDGVIQSGVGNSSLSANSTSALAGAQYFQSGASSATATAIGNMIKIDVSGVGNTVVLNSTQINNAAVSASAVLNGSSAASK